jgi:hypothetical protein
LRQPRPRPQRDCPTLPWEAAESLGQAAAVLESNPAAMQLRTLSTMVVVAAEKNSTLIFPIPVELIRLAEALSGRTGGPAT